MPEKIKVMVLTILFLAAGCFLLPAAGCNGKNKGVKNAGKEGGEGGDGKGAGKPSTRLGSVQVKVIEPADNEELAGEVEMVVAFKNVSKLVSCEALYEGEEPIEGTVVVQFDLDGESNLSGEPSTVLTTSRQEGPLEECLAGVLGEIDFSSISIEGSATFHLILKYGRQAK
ncbi:MAG: hypothetical protein ABIJ56_19355 [Pseudomonadota bacterium]